MSEKKTSDEVVYVDLNGLDLSCQTRAAIDQQAVDEYTQAILDGKKLPPGLVVEDRDGRKYLAGGFHRREAHRRAHQSSMPVRVVEGTKYEAIRLGIKDNREHRAVRITNADKKHNAMAVLREQPSLGDQAIADLVGIHRNTVAKYRKQFEGAGTCTKSASRICKDGREINVSKIGKGGMKRGGVEDRDPSSLGSNPTNEPSIPADKEGPADVPATATNPEPSEPNVTAGPATEPQPTKDNCGCGAGCTANVEGGQFCLECGAVPAEVPADERECPVCKDRNWQEDEDGRFCGTCKDPGNESPKKKEDPPKRSQCPKLPTKQYFEDGQKLLAKVASHFRKVNKLFPAPAQSNEFERLYGLMSHEIVTWEEEVTRAMFQRG